MSGDYRGDGPVGWAAVALGLRRLTARVQRLEQRHTDADLAAAIDEALAARGFPAVLQQRKGARR